MAEIQFTCPECGNACRVGEQFAGRSAKCVKCQAAFTVPIVSGTAAPDAKNSVGKPPSIPPLPQVSPRMPTPPSPAPPPIRSAAAPQSSRSPMLFAALLAGALLPGAAGLGYWLSRSERDVTSADAHAAAEPEEDSTRENPHLLDWQARMTEGTRHAAAGDFATAVSDFEAALALARAIDAAEGSTERVPETDTALRRVRSGLEDSERLAAAEEEMDRVEARLAALVPGLDAALAVANDGDPEAAQEMLDEFLARLPRETPKLPESEAEALVERLAQLQQRIARFEDERALREARAEQLRSVMISLAQNRPQEAADMPNRPSSEPHDPPADGPPAEDEPLGDQPVEAAPVRPPARINLTGRWRSRQTGSIFSVRDQGGTVTVTLEQSPRYSAFCATWARVGDHFEVNEWWFTSRADRQKRRRHVRQGNVTVLNENTIRLKGEGFDQANIRRRMTVTWRRLP